MNYRYASARNYQDFASGRVIYARPGQPAFPVRLASEIFQRCYEHWQKAGGSGRCTLFDPTSGGAYWLVALAYLHWEKIEKIVAADIDADAVTLAACNLSLLTIEGLNRRITEIERMMIEFGKKSHAEALKSAQTFQEILSTNLQSHHIQARTFRADVLCTQEMKTRLDTDDIDILLADVPHGKNTDWQGDEPIGEGDAINQMMAALLPVLSRNAVIAITADKKQKIRREGYQRLERFQVGKRRVEILRME